MDEVEFFLYKIWTGLPALNRNRIWAEVGLRNEIYSV